jgi:hypothetical protein
MPACQIVCALFGCKLDTASDLCLVDVLLKLINLTFNHEGASAA